MNTGRHTRAARRIQRKHTIIPIADLRHDRTSLREIQVVAECQLVAGTPAQVALIQHFPIIIHTGTRRNPGTMRATGRPNRTLRQRTRSSSLRQQPRRNTSLKTGICKPLDRNRRSTRCSRRSNRWLRRHRYSRYRRRAGRWNSRRCHRWLRRCRRRRCSSRRCRRACTRLDRRYRCYRSRASPCIRSELI